MSLTEVNFDGIVGPSHNYAGLSLGNIASASHRGDPSYPRAAALQGVAKMRGNLARLGVQGFLLPLPRPNAQLQATMLSLRRYLQNYMEIEVDRLEAALGDDTTAVLTAKLNQDSRSAQLSGLWDARISDEIYCKYLRLNQEGFLSSFGICAIAASFSLMSFRSFSVSPSY